MPKILVIEDEKDLLFIFEEILKSSINDCKVITAQSGEEGLEKAQKELPDTILLDIILPGIDGYEVCKILKTDEHTKNIPIIIITGVVKDTKGRIKALEMGADVFLIKPVEPGELIAQVNVMLRIKKVEDKLIKEKSILEELVKGRTKKLKESESQYHKIYNSTTDSFLIFDLDGNIIEANPQACKMYGFTYEEIIKLSSKDIIHSDYYYLFVQFKKDVQASGEFHAESVDIRKNGTLFDVEVRGTQFNYKGKSHLLAVIRDITEHKRTEQIQKTLYNISNAINITRDINELFKMIHAELGKIINLKNFYVALYSNDTNIVSIPYYVDELLKETPKSQQLSDSLTSYVIHTSKSLYLTEEKREQLIKEGKIAQTDWKNKIWLGAPLKIDNQVIGAMAVQSYTDASLYSEKDLEILEFVSDQIAIAIDRKQTEEALQRSEERYRTMIENANDMIWIVDTNGNFTFINHKSELVSGYNIKDWIGKSFVPLIHPDDLEIVNEVFQKTLLGERQHYIVRIFDKNKEQLYLSVNTAPIYEKDKVVGTVSFGRDITEQKHSEQLQTVLYNIANEVYTTKEVSELLSSVRDYLSTIIETTNFYVALYDKKTDTISLPYDVDEKDEFISFPAGKTLTSYVLRTGKSALADEELCKKLTRAGEIELIGTPSKIWLGVPLKVENEVIGVVVVQSYSDATLYTKKDLEILEFVSEQVALAIERKKASEKIRLSLKEKEIMLQEIHHRVKNNLQIIISLLNLQSRRIKNKETQEIFNISKNRIRSMALIHEKLYQTEDLASINFKDYIENLTSNLLNTVSLDPDKVNTNIEVENDIYLDVNRAIPCGLIINELISNALKFAFPEGIEGTLSIKMYKDKKEKNILIIKDDGIGLPNDFNLNKVESLGMQLVTSLTEQLNGALELDKEKGTTFRVVF